MAYEQELALLMNLPFDSLSHSSFDGYAFIRSMRAERTLLFYHSCMLCKQTNHQKTINGLLRQLSCVEHFSSSLNCRDG
ncbi:hypothetical protein T01_9666 [Trichinella spiralis]|uniref:Uncharacterized protein n=1 Tax=Trichinella spiralis TaxID=6334 RepID=A0A0V1BLY4_TRISP|nr:hypothetical protein T01_9666 [Trichinella spiralis]